ncbi:MAG TPA: hypothetical protein VH277_12085, partial [Gemmatimonadaceae bacterium]|nr:hypothetical protein [Gemmatimonadaceae bacterium]
MRNAQHRSARRWTAAGLLLIASSSTAARAQKGAKSASQVGTWTTLPYAMPINPVHLALLH